MSTNCGPNRRSFLAWSAAVAAVPAVAALAGSAWASPASADTLPDYAPIPKSALGPAVNAQGYFVGRVEKNLYWVTDATYQAAFLTTRDGVVLFDAPPTIGHNLQRAIDEVASANGVSNKVTHIIRQRGETIRDGSRTHCWSSFEVIDCARSYRPSR